MADQDTDLATLMARDPLLLSDTDITTIVSALRENRHKFVQGNKRAGTPAAKKTAAQKKGEVAVSLAGDIDLGL